MIRRAAVHSLLAACALGFAHSLPAREAEKEFTPRALAAASSMTGGVTFLKIDSLLRGQDRGRSNGERLFALVLFELWRQEYGVTF
jgi:hypothetical protein